MIIIPASLKSPVLRCVTCGNLPETGCLERITSKVIIRTSDSLRKEKRKSWKQLITPREDKKVENRGKLVKCKAILFSYFMIDCVARKHKIVKHIKPFKVKPGTARIV